MTTALQFEDSRSSQRVLDPLLIPFIQTADEDRARLYLEDLICQHVVPVVTAAVRYYAPALAHSNGGREGDLHIETVYCILQRLGAIRQYDASPISDVRNFTYGTVRNLCRQYFKRKKEYTFSSLVPGLDAGDQIATLVEGSSIEFVGDSVSSLVEQRYYLQSVWREIRALPRMQRLAILYNFRDKNGANALPLLALCRVTTEKDLADALNVATDDLESLFDRLPMADSDIAATLGISQRDVINQRMLARRGHPS